MGPDPLGSLHYTPSVLPGSKGKKPQGWDGEAKEVKMWQRERCGKGQELMRRGERKVESGKQDDGLQLLLTNSKSAYA